MDIYAQKPGPFTFKRQTNNWEVLFIVNGKFKRYVQCETRADAVALSNFRVFYHRAEYGYAYTDSCDLGSLEATLDALRRHGLNGHFGGFRQLEALARRERAKLLNVV